MNFLEAIDARDMLIMFGAGIIAGVALYFVRTRVLSAAENALQIPTGGTL